MAYLLTMYRNLSLQGCGVAVMRMQMVRLIFKNFLVSW